MRSQKIVMLLLHKLIRLMEEILHQLRLVVYPIYLQGFFYIPGSCLGFLNHQQYDTFGSSSDSVISFFFSLSHLGRVRKIRSTPGG